MFTVNFYASCFASRGNSIGKKLIRLDWEKAVYRSLFTLANTLHTDLNYENVGKIAQLNTRAIETILFKFF